MNEQRLSIYNGVFLGVTLIITLYLIQQFQGVKVLFFALIFMVFNTLKDIVLHKLGFTFSGFGIKKMIILDLIVLCLFIIWYLFWVL